MLGALRKLGSLFGRSAETARQNRNVRLNLEPLEDRRVLSVTAGIDAGVLEIIGTGSSVDVVTVTLNGDGQIEVTYSSDGVATTTELFDPADITNRQIDIQLGGGADDLTLALIERASGGPGDTQGFDISVDMGNGTDVVRLEDNVGDGGLLPLLDVTSETIRVGGALGDTYETSDLTLNGNVILQGSVVITTTGGDFDSTGASLSALDANTNDELVPDFDLTINTGANDDARLGVVNDAGGANINNLIVNSGGDVTFVRVTGAGNNVTVGSLDVEGATVTVRDNISVTEGGATFESDGVMTFDPDAAAASIVIDTHGGDLTFISGVTGQAAFSIADTIFRSHDPDDEPAGGTVTFRPGNNATPIEIGTPDAPAVPDPAAFRVNLAQFGSLATFDGIEIGSAQQSGTIGVFDPVDVAIDLHLHAGMGDIFIGATVDSDGDVLVTGDGSTTTVNANMTAASLTFLDDVLIGSNVTLRANGGAAGDITFSSTIDSEPGETNNLVLDADDDITVTGAIGTTDRLNNLRIDDANDVTFASTVRLAGNLTQDAGDGITTFNGTSGTGIAGELDVTTDTVVFSTADMVVVGNVTVEAENAITLNAGAGINAGASEISLAANQDNAGAQHFTQAGTAIIQTTNNTADAVSIEVGGTGNALIGDIRASAGTVDIDSAGGAIVDNLAGVAPNIVANQLALDAATGIGADADGLEINANLLAARTVAGDLHVVDTAGGLTIGVVGALTGARITAGAATDNIRIAANSPLTVNSLVSNAGGGNITLVAGGATAADDLLINANVTTTGGNGSIELFAGDSIQVALSADVEASGTGSVLLSAGTDASAAVPVNGTATGEIVVGDGSEITSDDGDITLRAPGDVRVSFIDANDDADATIGDVFIQADFAGVGGGLSDGAGAIIDNLVAETANIIADRAELRAATGIGAADDIDTTVISIVAVNTVAGNIVLTETNAVDVVQLSQAGAANIQLTTTAGSMTVVSGGSGVTAGTGVVTLTAQGAASDIILQQDITTAAGGSVSLVAGDDIVDDGIATTLITTGNLSLSAVDNIGDITSFAAGTGTPIDVAVSGQLVQAAITTAGGEIFIRAQGNLIAGAGAINPHAGGVATALVTATGNLDVGTFGGVAVTAGDSLGLLAGGTLTLPAGCIDVGGAGTLRLVGNTDVQDGDHSLGPFVANSLEFVSGSAIGTLISTNVATLTAEMTTLGTGLTVVEQDDIALASVTTNDGDLVVVLANPGDISVSSVDAGTGLAALVAAPLFPFAGDGAILDGDGPALDTVDVIGGQVLLLATQGIGTDANALEIDGVTLAATTVTGDINISDVAGGVTVGNVAGFNGVTVTGGVLGDDVRLATQGAGADLAIGTVVSTVGSGAVSLSASDDVSFAATGSITTVGGNVSVDANGGIVMTDGSQIVTTGGGVVDLLAQNDIALSRVQATLSDVIVTSAGGAITDGGDLLGANISANQTALRAADGIGTGNPLETTVNVLSARNTATGSIELSSVTNPAFGALLTIGTVDGLAGVVNTAPGQAVVISNFGPINVNGLVASAGAITLTAATPLLLPVNPGNLTVNAQVAATGAVSLNAGSNLFLNDSGQANDVVGDTVTGNAGTLVTFGPNVIVRSTNPAGAGAVADKLPAFTPLIPDVDNDQDTLDQLPFLQVFFNIGRVGEANLFVLVEFDIQGTASGAFNGANPNVHLDGTILDAGAGFFIRITVTDPAGITFFEGGTEVALPPFQFDFTPVFVPFLVELPRAEPLTPALADPIPPPTYAALAVPIQQLNTFEDLATAPDVPQSTDVRIIVVEKIGPDNQVEQDRTDRPIVREYVDAEAEAILENPSKLFEQLKSGRFRIWLKDGIDAPRNLIWDVILQNGRPQAGGEGTERPPTEIPAETQESGQPRGEAAPAPKSSETSETPVPGAAAPEVDSVSAVDGAADVTPDDGGLPTPSQQPLPENRWRIARRLETGAASPVRSNSP